MGNRNEKRKVAWMEYLFRRNAQSASLKTEKAAKNSNNSQLSPSQLRTITILSSAKFEAQLIFLSTTKYIFFIFKLFTYRKWCYSCLFNWLCILGLFWLGHCIFWFTVLGPRLENFIEKERIRYVLITCFHEFCKGAYDVRFLGR